MTGISDMDWAQHIKMDYAQNMRKDPTKAKNFTFRWFIEDPASPFKRSGQIKPWQNMKYIQFYENA